MLEDDDGVLAPQRSVHQAYVVERRRWRDNSPTRGGGEDPGRVHGMLRPVAGAGGYLATQDEGHLTLAPEHVPGLADLVEKLIGSHPHEVGVHELHDRLKAAVESDSAPQTREGILADRCAQHPVGIGLLQTSGGAVGPAVEAMNVLTHHHDALVGLHPTCHHRGHRVNELRLRDLAHVRVLVSYVSVPELTQVPADPDVDERGVRPLRGLDLSLSRLAARARLEQNLARFLHDVSGTGEGLVHGGLTQNSPAQQVPHDLGDRVACPPSGFLLLGPVPEGTAWEGAVLVEVAVGVCFDDGWSVAGTHVCQGLLHGEVDGEGIHPVNFPAGDSEPRAAGRQSRLPGRLCYSGRYGVEVVLNAAADRQMPGSGEVKRL